MDNLGRRELETGGSDRRPDSCLWQGDESFTSHLAKKGEKWELERLERKNLGFSRTWLLAMCRGLGSQDDSETQWPGEKLVPFSEKVNPGHGCYTGGRALGLHLGPAQVCSLLFTFHRQRWEPAQATPVTYSCPGGDSPGGEAVLYLFSIDDAPPKEARVVCFPVIPPEARPVSITWL